MTLIWCTELTLPLKLALSEKIGVNFATNIRKQEANFIPLSNADNARCSLCCSLC